MSTDLVLHQPEEMTYTPAHIGGRIPADLAELNQFAALFVQSGMFAETRQAAQAAVKILRGAELGLTPFAAMDGLHIIQGRITMSANLMAAQVQKSKKYRYRVKTLTDDACVIEFSEKTEKGWEVVGTSEWTRKDASRAGTKNMDKYPRNMNFARALANGFRIYCPELSHGAPLYVPEELGAQTDEAGRVIETSFVPDNKAQSQTVQQTAETQATTTEAKAETTAAKKAPDPPVIVKQKAVAALIGTILDTKEKINATTAISLCGNMTGVTLAKNSPLETWTAFHDVLAGFVEMVQKDGHTFGSDEWHAAVSKAVGFPVDTLTALAPNDWVNLFRWLETGNVALAPTPPAEDAAEEAPNEDDDL